MEWFFRVVTAYAIFKGRAGRKEYWMFVLFNVIFAVIAFLLCDELKTDFHSKTVPIIFKLVALVYGLCILLPSLAVTCRRLHDIGKNGWTMFLVLIPVVGVIWLIVLLAKEGTSNENKYGTSPDIL